MQSMVVRSATQLTGALAARRVVGMAAALLALAAGAAFGGPALSISPGSLSFDDQPINTTSAAQSVSLTNTGDAPLLVASVFNSGGNTGEFNGTQNCTDAPLAPGASCAIVIQFTPGGPGARSTTLTIVSNAPGNPHTVALSGNGTQPAAPGISISPGGLSFGEQAIGTTSGEQTVSVTNTGSAPLNVGVSGPTGAGAGDFSVSTGCGTAPIAPGGSCGIAVRFEPTATGTRSASLVITSNAAGGPRTVSLSGVGSPHAAPGIKVSPSSLSFARQQVGDSSSPKSVTVTNTGAGPLVVSSVTMTGDPDFLLDGGGGTVEPGDSLSISVTFAPSATGERNASLVISHNAAGSPHTVSLRGTGTEPPGPPPGAAKALVTPASLDFGRIAVGVVGDPLSVTVASTGTAPLVIRSVTLTGTQKGDFESLTEGVGTVAEGTSRTLQLRFAPAGGGSRTATLEIRTNATGSPHRVALSGIGVAVTPPPTGDWPVFMHDPRQLGLAEAGVDPRTLSPWSLPLGSRSAAAPVILGGTAYIGTEAGSVVAIDTTKHAQRWSRLLPLPARASLAASRDAVIVAAGRLYGLRPADGSTLWERTDIIPTPAASPMLVNGTIYVSARAPGGSGAALFAVQAATGRDAWLTPAPLPGGFESRGAVAAYPEIGLLFAGLGPPAESARPSAGPGAVIALRMADGAAAWATPALFPAAPPAGGLSVGWVSSTLALSVPQPAVFIAAGTRVTALGATTGATFWTRELLETSLQGPPVVSTAAPQGSTLRVIGASGKVYALRSTTGAETTGGLSTPGLAISGTPALGGDYLYLPTAAGLVAADGKTGAVVWNYPGAIASGVAVAAGVPYAVTEDGRFVGFGQ